MGEAGRQGPPQPRRHVCSPLLSPGSGRKVADLRQQNIAENQQFPMFRIWRTWNQRLILILLLLPDNHGDPAKRCALLLHPWSSDQELRLLSIGCFKAPLHILKYMLWSQVFICETDRPGDCLAKEDLGFRHSFFARNLFRF